MFFTKNELILVTFIFSHLVMEENIYLKAEVCLGHSSGA